MNRVRDTIGGFGDWGSGIRVQGEGFRVQDAPVCSPYIPVCMRTRTGRRPGGAEEAPRCTKNGEEHRQTCSRYGVPVSPTGKSFAPPGRTKKDNMPVFHGFRVGLLRSRAAPPVATVHRPFGARASIGQGELLTCPTWLPASGTPADTVTDPFSRSSPPYHL